MAETMKDENWAGDWKFDRTNRIYRMEKWFSSEEKKIHHFVIEI